MHFKIPLNSLNTFACTARGESFQRAAEQLNISPSAVSHQIRNLEQQLGYKLFHRLDKQVRLTESGRALYQRINQPLHQLHHAAELALQPSQPVVRISCAPIFATRWLMPRLSDFQACHPDIELSVQATTEQVDLESQQVDGLIRHGNQRWPQVNQQFLLAEQSVIVCRPTLFRRFSQPLDAHQLQHQPLLDVAAHSDRWKSWFARHGIQADRQRCSMSVQNGAQAIEACMLGDLFLLFDQTMLQRELADGSLVVACEVENDSPYGYSLLWSKQRPVSAAFETFQHWLATQLADCSTR